MAAVAMLPPPPLVAADECVREVLGVLDLCGPVSELPVGAATRLIGDVDAAVARLQSIKLGAIAVVDKARVADDAGMTGTDAWLRARSRTSGAEASRDLKLAKALDEGLAATGEALSAGELSAEHARVIADTTAKLPEDLTDEEREAVEESLVANAKRLDPPTLRRHARREVEEAGRSAAEADAPEDKLLRSEEDEALAKTTLSLHDNGDGTTTGHFTLPTLAAGILRKIVQQMASPRRFAQQAAKASREAGAQMAEDVAAATWEAFRAEDLTWAQKYGRAFVELLEHLPTDHLSGKVNATVVVTLDLEKLRAGLGAAHLDTGGELSASAVRRLACNAGLVPAVLGGGGLPLDLGRQDRFFTEAQRVALATVYESCAAKDCDRPYAWSELHHEDPWHRGGRTDLALAVPLCGTHHRLAHNPRYRVGIATDGRGIKTATFRLRT
jgi:Domain of unknown function (DUF222)